MELNEIMYVKQLEQCLGHSKYYLVNVKYYEGYYHLVNVMWKQVESGTGAWDSKYRRPGEGGGNHTALCEPVEGLCFLVWVKSEPLEVLNWDVTLSDLGFVRTSGCFLVDKLERVKNDSRKAIRRLLQQSRERWG